MPNSDEGSSFLSFSAFLQLVNSGNIHNRLIRIVAMDVNGNIQSSGALVYRK